MYLPSYNLNIAQSIAATTASDRIDAERMSHISFQVTQTAAGVSFAATIQQSNDGINWADTASTVAIAAAGTFYVEKSGACARFYRVNLVRTSGTLTGTVVVANGKF